MKAVLDMGGLDRIVQALRRQGRTVIGPVVSDGVITHAEIESASALPRGWTEEQQGGSYRLEPTGTDEVFAFSSPSSSSKRYVYPERTLLISASRRDGEVVLHQPDPEPPALAFFGIRSCDLAGLGVLGRVFGDPQHPDPTYRALRDDVFIIATACSHPGNTCFCVSMDTGPTPKSGFDLAVSELYDHTRHEFVVEAGSARGRDLLAVVGGRAPEVADIDAAAANHDRAVGAMGRTLAAEDPPLAAENLDHPRWDDIAERCLACGNCTMVCPTCFCGATEDVTNLSGTEAQRYRVWDSCFTLSFSQMQGSPVRSTTKSRYRQWLLHKLDTWHDQFDTSGCVGCGRCITWCPVGIDLTEEIAALAKKPGKDGL